MASFPANGELSEGSSLLGVLVRLLLGVVASSLGLSYVSVWLKFRRDQGAEPTGGIPCISTAAEASPRADSIGKTGPVLEIWMENVGGEEDEGTDRGISASHIRARDVEDSACNPTKV